MSAFNLQGRTALVTGGARGLGAAMARALVRDGASVMIGDVRVDEGRQTARELGADGPSSIMKRPITAALRHCARVGAAWPRQRRKA